MSTKKNTATATTATATGTALQPSPPAKPQGEVVTTATDADLKIANLETELAAAQAEANLAREVNRELREEIAKLQKLAPPPTTTARASKLSFTHGADTYGFAFNKIRLDGKDYTSDDVVKNKALQERLVSKNSGMLVKQKA